MRILKLAFKRERAMTMTALTLASGACSILVLARVIWTGQGRYVFLVWNLFLAWVPLLFSLMASEQYETRGGRNWKFLAWFGGWLVFFPNAPYIFTDVTHLTSRYFAHFWVDLALILTCALAGLIAGFVSLFLMHTLVAKACGRVASWVFIAGVAGLSSFGIYLGRFLRFNSWDLVFQPFALYRRVSELAGEPAVYRGSSGFLVLFAAFIFIAYVMLYGLTHLQSGDRAPNAPAPV